MNAVAESEIEGAALARFDGLGHAVLHGPDMGPGGVTPKRGSCDKRRAVEPGRPIAETSPKAVALPGICAFAVAREKGSGPVRWT